MPRLIDSDRAFGLEMEFTTTTPLTLVTHQLQTVCFPYSTILAHRQSRGGSWELKTDSSCGNGFFMGLELVSPKLRSHQWDTVRRALDALRAVNASVSDRCGFHVHHAVPDFRSNRMFARLLRLWGALEPVALSCCDSTRYGNMYCNLMRSRCAGVDVPGIRAARRMANDVGRYVTLNLLPFWRLGTVEFRAHHGTLQYDDIWWWTTFTQAIVDLSATRLRRATIERLERASGTDRVNLFADIVSRHFQDSAVATMLEGLPRKTQTSPVVLEFDSYFPPRYVSRSVPEVVCDSVRV